MKKDSKIDKSDLMSSINEVSNLDELICMYKIFCGYFLGDLEHLYEIAQKITNEEEEALQQRSPSIVYPPMTTKRPGDKICDEPLPDRTRCTAPLCMLLFSGIDVVGQLTRPQAESSTEPFAESKKFAKNAQIFMHHLTGDDSLKNNDLANMLSEDYRNFIAHNYLPGAGSRTRSFGVSFIHDHYSHSLFQDKNGIKILDVNYLSRRVREGLLKFKDVIASDKFTDQIINIYNNKILRYNGG